MVEAGEAERGVETGDGLVGDISVGDGLRDILEVRWSPHKNPLDDVKADDLVLSLLCSIIVKVVCPRIQQIVGLIISQREGSLEV